MSIEENKNLIYFGNPDGSDNTKKVKLKWTDGIIEKIELVDDVTKNDKGVGCE